MSLLQRLEMRQGQSLVMTPQLLQAIKLLQLSHLDLVAYVEAELEKNPLLERSEAEPDPSGPSVPEREASEPEETWLAADLDPSRSEIEREMDTGLDNVFPDETPVSVRQAGADCEFVPLTPAPWSGGSRDFDDDGPTLETSLTSEASLTDHLEVQLDLATRSPQDRMIGRYLINAIDEAGYLSETAEEVGDRLGTPTAEVERVVNLIQTFDPPGIGARNLAECLALQLRERDRFDPAMQALVARLDLVAKRDFAALRRACGVDDEDLAEMLREIRRLEPKPGRAFGSAAVDVLVPDVVVRMAPDGSWFVELNPDTLPRVLVNQSYYARVSKTARDTDKAFLTDCLQTANWLTRSLEQRAKTILKVATEIVRQQDGFFRHGVSHLRPLNLKTVAEEIGMHESTVSRVTSNKAIGTSRGTFEMKYFFTAAIAGAPGAESHSSEAVRHRIRQLIDAEPASQIFSDDDLVKRLKAEGIEIARRTVAKYRESLRIPSSIDRRRAKQVHMRAS